MHDSELIRHYTLDGAGIMFVTDLIRDTLTYLTPRRNAIAPEMEVNHHINIFGNWKNATMQQWKFGYVTTFYKQSDHTITALSKALLCRCSFPIKYVKYDSMVNKN